MNGLGAISVSVWFLFVVPEAMGAHNENASFRNTFKYKASAATFTENIPIPRIPVNIENAPLFNNVVSLVVVYSKWVRCRFVNPFFVRLQGQQSDIIIGSEGPAS